MNHVTAVTRSEGTRTPKACESSSLREILDAPVAALAGASDAEALKSAFNIKTGSDLGENEYFQTAVALYELSQTGAK